MFNFLYGFQLIATVLIFICTVRLVRAKGYAGSKYLILTAACVDMYAFGYLIEMAADSFDGAIAAVQLEYCGLSFMALNYYMFVSDYCKSKRIPKAIIHLITFFNVIVLALVTTCKKNSLFYASVKFVTEGIFPHLETTKGIFYWLFNVEQVSLPILCSISFYHFYHKCKKVNDRKLFLALFLESLVPIVGLIINISPLIPIFDMGSIMTGIMLSSMILTLTNGRLFDIRDIGFLSLYENLGSGIIIADSDGHYVESNVTAKVIFPVLSTLDNSHPVSEVHDNLFVENGDNYFEVNKVYYSSTCRRLFEKGHHVGFIISITDVTEMRQRIDEMASLKEAADSANEAKSAFLANMSHEIRTPLNAIIGMAELSEKEKSSAVIQDYVSQIKSAGKMLLDIVTDVLDFSKAESGKLEIVPVDYDLLELLNSVINVTNMRIGDKPLDFFINIDPSIPRRLNGDDVRVRQVLMNFLSNAEKYTDSGHISLYCEYASTSEGIILKFAVEDTGRGIADVDYDKLFKPFSQVDLKRNRKITGTGLGLSIAGQLIELMNGNKTVTSVYGRGSTFSFEVPQKIVDSAPLKENEKMSTIKVPKSSSFYLFRDNSEVVEEAKEEEKEVTFKDANVLVVDDNKVNVKVLCAYLKHFGITPDSCYSAKESYLLTVDKHYDVIFMDHMMPDIDGVEATQYIRSSENNLCKDSVIIACTANVIKGVQELFEEAGMNDFIPKPLQMSSLKTILVKYLKDKIVE